jgi:hypothetical protein
MRKLYYNFIFILALCVSCYNEDDLIELSAYDDFVMEITIYFDPNYSNEVYKFDIVDYKTDGYNQLISYPGSYDYESNVSFGFKETFYFIVKEYKTVGVKITPIKNIIGYRFTIREFSSFNPNYTYSYPDDTSVIDIKNNINGETTILYDFETDNISIVEN